MQIRIIDTTTGKEPTWKVIEKIAKDNGLVYCDIEGFAINEDGQIVLLDECGKYTWVSMTRFKVEWVEEEEE